MRRFHLVWLLPAVVALCAPAPAAASFHPITGKLSKRGYTVIAVGYGGKTSTTRSRSFRLVPRASRVTLQLRDPKGRYGGPVVVGGTAKKVVLGVRAGAKLGTIKVERGYAKAANARKAGIDKHRTATAKHGVPLGNGRNFGLVRTKAHGRVRRPGRRRRARRAGRRRQRRPHPRQRAGRRGPAGRRRAGAAGPVLRLLAARRAARALA